MSVSPREDRPGLAVASVMTAFLCFTCLDTSAKWLVGAGVPALQVVFMRYAGHFALSVALFVPREGIGVFRSRAPLLQAARGLVLLSATICNFIALRYLPLTVTTAIIFAAPILVCLLSIPLLGERVGARRLAAVIVGFLGVLIVVRPGGSAFHPAMALSLVTLIATSLYFILTRMIAGKEDNPTGQLWTSGLPMLAIAPFALQGWVWPAGVALVLAFLIGGLAAIGHSMLTIGHRYGEASRLAPLVYVQVLYATVASWAVFGEPPGIDTALGTAVIVGAGLYIWLRERSLRRDRIAAIPPPGTPR